MAKRDPDYETAGRRPPRRGVASTIYFYAGLHPWLKHRAITEGTTLSELVNRYCQEGRIRDELADAAATVEPDPGALAKIQQRIREQP
jgi:hypothetical protein